MTAALLAALLSFGLVIAAPGAAVAQSILGGDAGDDPVTVEAEEGIEWRRDERQYIARGNARATRGDVTINADVLTALYREKDGREKGGGGSEIYRIIGEKDVLITAPDRKAWGDQVVYDVDTQVAVLTGEGLRMESADERIVARDSLEYWQLEELAIARGNASATRGERTITADVLTARFAVDAAGDRSIRRMEAIGNVVIVTPQEVVRGAEGVYDVPNEIATLRGGVRITRGQNQLNGEIAEVNLRTGVSRLLGGAAGMKRVQGLFQPGGKSGN
jgi:lipopolysaccharide export system protein LptA